MVTAKTKYSNMNKSAEAKYVFRKIDNLLKDLEILPPAQQVKTIKTLRKINEDLCDAVVTIVIKYGRIIKDRDKQNSDQPPAHVVENG